MSVIKEICNHRTRNLKQLGEEIGYHPSFVGRVARGERPMSLNMAVKLYPMYCEIKKVSMEDFLYLCNLLHE